MLSWQCSQPQSFSQSNETRPKKNKKREEASFDFKQQGHAISLLSTAVERGEAANEEEKCQTKSNSKSKQGTEERAESDITAMIPVELFLQQVQARVQLVALLSAQAVQRRVEGRWGGHAAAGDLLVLAAPSTLPPETEDVGYAGEGPWEEKKEELVHRRNQSILERDVLDSVQFLFFVPDKALQVFPVLGSPSPSLFSLNFMGGA